MASGMGAAAAAAAAETPRLASPAAAAAAAPGPEALPRRKVAKLHGRAFYESIGSPRFIVAPMVDQSEFAWRMLTRSFLPEAERSRILAYSPMLHARLFTEGPKYRSAHFEPRRGEPAAPPAGRMGQGGYKGCSRAPAAFAATAPAAAAAAAAAITAVGPTGPTRESLGKETGGIEAQAGTQAGETEAKEPPAPYLDGNPSLDRPLIVQFCANDPAVLLAAAQAVAPHCDAVDLNLGCPQGIARKGQYGAFLQERKELIADMIRTLHENLAVPVTAKMRVLDTPEATLAYARTLLAAGASILTVHGRRREQKGHLTGVADWGMIRYLRDNLPPDTVLFANGNVLQHADLETALAATGADGIMSAEGNLSDPAIFVPPPPPPPSPSQDEPGRPMVGTGREYWRGRDGLGGWRVDAVIRRYLDILYKYCLGLEEDEMPSRRPLFCPGDDEAWIAEGKARRAQQEAEEPARKRRKKDHTPTEAVCITNRNTRADFKGTPAAIDKAAKQAAAALAVSPNLTACQPHLFHLLRHFVIRHHDVRDILARSGRWAGGVSPRKRFVDTYEAILALAELKIAEGLLAYERTDGRSIEDEWAREAEEKSEKLRRQAGREAEARRKQEEQQELSQKLKQAGRNEDEDQQQPQEKEKRQRQQQQQDSKEREKTVDTQVEGQREEAEEEAAAAAAASAQDGQLATSADAVRRCRRPWWVCQPIVRPLPSEALLKGAIKPKGSGKGLDGAARQEASVV